MVKNPKYILLQDTEAIFSRIGGNAKTQFNTAFIKAIESYLTTLRSFLRVAFDNKVDIQTYSELQVERAILRKVTGELKTSPNVVCICLDRFLLADIETSDAYRQRFFRFGICRSVDDKKVPRQGSVPFLEQLENLKQTIPELDNKQLVIVDNGIFSGGTIKEFLKLMSTNGIKAPIKKIICFVGDQEHLKDSNLVPLEIVKPVKNLHDWIDIRDFSPFGGKVLNSSRSNQVSSSVPYLYPWSDGANASLNMSPQLFTVSKNMIKAFKELVMTYEGSNGNKPLTFRNLVKKGFSLPTNLEKNIPISINDSVTGYLDLCIELIQREQNRQVAIFDMEGTLYKLDGKNNGYRESTLDKVVQQNAIEFIKEKESCTDAQANAVLCTGLIDEIGLSAYLSRKYGISRVEYFNYVWNISPAGIIKNGNQSAETIALLKRNPQLKVVLLTSSPRVWTEQVLHYLEIDRFFESIYTGEQYGQKEEIFILLAGRYKPENMISIGDQYQTDIKPARELGMRVFEVSTPEDLHLLIS